MKLLSRLTSGLSKTSSKLGGGITGIFTKKKLDGESLDALEELLIEADIGAATAAMLVESLRKQRFGKDITPEEVKAFLAAEIADILAPLAIPLLLPPPQAGEGRVGEPLQQRVPGHEGSPLNPPASGGTIVVMMVGVNGNGKTTTIGKLASQWTRDGKKVMLAAADTFRAAAVEQLQVWGTRAGVPVITGEPESDPASVAFRAYELAREQGADILLIDTAGRLQNKSNLMTELHKISKVLKKIDSSAPHHVVQVLDATTGQNALSQVQAFKELVEVSGLVITKLDGTARGGIVVALAKQFGLPVYAIGVGEGIEDIGLFDPADFAAKLLGN